MNSLLHFMQIAFLFSALNYTYGASVNCSCNPGWYAMQNIHGVSVGKPAITSFEANSLNIFVRGRDGQLWARYYEDGKWLGWVQHWGRLTSAPSASSPGGRRIYIAVRGSDNQYWVRLFNSNEWMAWEAIGGNSTLDPAIISYETNHIHVFLCSPDGLLFMRTQVDGSWAAWMSLDKTCTSPPTATMMNGRNFCVAIVNADKSVSIGMNVNGTWSWYTLAIPSKEAVSVTTWDFNKLVLSTKNQNGATLMTIFDTGSKSIESMTQITNGIESAVSTTFVGYKNIGLAGANSMGETIIYSMSA